MSTRMSGYLLITILLFTTSGAEAQQPTKVPRIGYVSGSGNPSNPGPQIETFRQGLRDLGYIEGKISSSSIATLRENWTGSLVS